MARNWGGDGIEKFLEPGESLELRFSNYYLTNRRLGHYKTLKSIYEFVPLGDFDMVEGHGRLIEFSLISIIILFASMAVLGLFTIFTDPVFTIIGVVGTFQVFYAYSLLRRWSRDSYLIKFRGEKGKWILRTFNSDRGLSFALEVVKANNAFRNLDRIHQDSISS